MKLSKNIIIAVIIILILVAIVFVALYPSGQVRLESVGTNRPDLIIDSFGYAPENPQTGEAVLFSGTVKNTGNSPAMNVTISIDFGNGKQETSALEEPLLPGMIHDFSFEQAYILPGNYTARVTVQTTDDSDNNNNMAELVVAIFSGNSYDLTITDITWEPEHPAVGDEVQFSIHVQNIGSGTSAETQAVFDSVEVHNFVVPELLPGQSGVEEFSVAYSSAGEYSAYAEIFADDENIYNNFRNESLTVTSDSYPVADASHSPSQNITTETIVLITATGSDDYGLLTIQIYVDSLLRKTCSVTGLQASCIYNSTYYNGTHAYYARVTDTAYHVTNSQQVNFTVTGNATDAPPEVNVTFSPSQITANTPVTLTASAEDNTDIKKIEIYVDDVIIATCNYPGFEQKGECIYKSVFVAGTHELYAEVTDNFNNIVASTPAEFIVS